MSVSRDPRFTQANKEALFSLAAYALYFVWWFVSAFCLGDGDPERYTYVLGLPAWFFYSCVLGFPMISLVVWIMVRMFFRDMPLDDLDEHPPSRVDNPQPTNEQGGRS